MANLPYGISGPSTTTLFQYRITPPVLPDGSTFPGQVDINGNLKVVVVSGGGGPGGGGDASSANQVIGNNSLSSIDTKMTSVVSNTNISKGIGTVDSNTTRVTIASDGALMSSVGLQADAVATTDTGSFSLISFIKRGLQNWTTLLSRIPTLVSGMLPVIASCRTVIIGTTITRTGGGNTTAYAANQVIANATGNTYSTFTGLARITGGTGVITKARLITNQLNNTASYRLHLFHSLPTTNQTDGTAYQLLFANRDKAIGTIDISNLTSEGGTAPTDSSRGINTDIRLDYANGTSADIFVILQVLSPFTPTSGQQFYIELTAIQN